MRFGPCIGPDLMGAAAAVGCDFLDLPTTALLPEEPEDRFQEAREVISSAPVQPEVWRLVLPPGANALGPSVDSSRISRCVHTSFRRAAAAGGSVVALGAGDAWRAPDGLSATAARGQLAEFVGLCGEVARGCGLMVGVEAGRASCGHLVTSLPEAVALARGTGMSEVGVLADASQMAGEGHSPFDVVDAAEWLAHVRVSHPMPAAPSPAAQWLREFLDALAMADYDWRISIRADWAGAGDVAAALQSVRSFCEATGDRVRGGHA